MTATKHPRIPCGVPFCRRGSTAWAPGHLIICAKCWRLVSAETKRIYRLARRKDRPGLQHLAWRRALREAIAASGGL